MPLQNCKSLARTSTVLPKFRREAAEAARRRSVRIVTVGALRTVLIGGRAGVCVSVVAVGSLRSLLFGVDAHDPVRFGAVAAILIKSAGAAALVAARRGANIVALLALRGE